MGCYNVAGCCNVVLRGSRRWVATIEDYDKGAIRDTPKNSSLKSLRTYEGSTRGYSRMVGKEIARHQNYDCHEWRSYKENNGNRRKMPPGHI